MKFIVNTDEARLLDGFIGFVDCIWVWKTSEIELIGKQLKSEFQNSESPIYTVTYFRQSVLFNVVIKVMSPWGVVFSHFDIILLSTSTSSAFRIA